MRDWFDDYGDDSNRKATVARLFAKAGISPQGEPEPKPFEPTSRYGRNTPDYFANRDGLIDAGAGVKISAVLAGKLRWKQADDSDRPD